LKRFSDLLDLRERRSRVDVMSDILTIVTEGALKTQIMYRANLSFAQLYSYLNLLLNMKLIKEVDRPTGKFYEITEKGKKVLDILESLRSLLCSQETMIKGVTK